MKNTKICPKCQSANIVRIDGYDGGYGGVFMTGLTIFSESVYVNRYICCDCGFTEEWIDEEDIKKVMESKKAKQ